MKDDVNLFRADLHCHSTCSDGSLTPQELISLAANLQLQGLAITDHDNINAYQTNLCAANSHIQLITGVEFSSMHKKTSIHILAYSFAPGSADILDFCQQHQIRRQKRMEEMIRLVNKAGMPISAKELYALHSNHKAIGRPHLAQLMVEKGYAADMKQAFKLYLGEGKRCYCSGQVYSVEETLERIKAANAFSVLAHPHLIDHPTVLKDLLQMPFDGIECYYAKFNPSQNSRWVTIGTQKKWLMTGGSDFHGIYKPQLQLGSSWTGKETFEHLYQRFNENQNQQP